MSDLSPADAGGLLKTIGEIFGPGGAGLAILSGYLGWIKYQDGKDHKEERAALVAQIKDSEQKRRDDIISQYGQISAFVTKSEASDKEVAKSLVDLRIAFAAKGIINA